MLHEEYRHTPEEGFAQLTPCVELIVANRQVFDYKPGGKRERPTLC